MNIKKEIIVFFIEVLSRKVFIFMVIIWFFDRERGKERNFFEINVILERNLLLIYIYFIIKYNESLDKVLFFLGILYIIKLAWS